MVDIDKCRYAFEEWMWKVNGIACDRIRRGAVYSDAAVTRTWNGWKEGAKWQNEAVKGS